MTEAEGHKGFFQNLFEKPNMLVTQGKQDSMRCLNKTGLTLWEWWRWQVLIEKGLSGCFSLLL